MTNDREKFAELGELLGALRDGTIADEQMELLDRLLATDAGAQEYYLQYMDICATLGHFQGALAKEKELHDASPAHRHAWPDRAEGSDVGRNHRTSPRNGSRLFPKRRLFLCAAAAIVIGLGMGIFYLSRPAGPVPSGDSSEGPARVETVAVLTRAVQPEWEGNAPAIGSKIRVKERLRLRSGTAQLEFFSGAVLVIEGPADFELKGVGRIYCREGRMRARVSPPAEGFIIESPVVKLVDRGTEFGFHIDRAGGAEVHVFHGKVELHNADDNSVRAEAPHFTSGNGVSIDSKGAFRKIAADPQAFVSAANLEQEWRGELRRRHERWLTQSQKLRADSRLILYYTFQDQPSWERTLINQALVRKGELDGAIIGCAWGEGRWPGKGALDFKRPSDRVRIHVPGTYESLTFLAWVRVDAFDQRISALMLTDGFLEGAPHWQLTDQGKVLLGVKNSGDGFRNYYSPVFLKADKLGEWLQLATVYDHRFRTVTHYVDGRPISREDLRFDIDLRIGNVEIGNWGRPNHVTTWFPVRNFNGRIDEFALFRESLSAEEIARLYEFGKACP